MNKINVTELAPAQIKAELEMRGYTVASLGRMIGKKRQDVSFCIHNWQEVLAAIDELINSTPVA